MEATPSFLIVTRQDQRTPRKVNIHFIAEEFVKRGRTRMFSFAFSRLSRLKKDQRTELWESANKVEICNGVECYLWRTLLHPVNLRKKSLRMLEAVLFSLYVAVVPRIFKQWVRESSFILFESGFPQLLLRACRKLNPEAQLVYLASDSLTAINCAETIVSQFAASGNLYDYFILPSRFLKTEMPKNAVTYFVPHGLDISIAEHKDPSPYEGGVNIVTVGSMLFDESFFIIAAEAFPDIAFHVIGSGTGADNLSAPNIKVYGEMPFLETIPYVNHANAGVAPYQGERVAPFLVDTSMKLMQFGFLGVPAICPHVVVGAYEGRFGYIPGDKASIIAAVKNALRRGRLSGSTVLSWSDVANRIIDPMAYSDTAIL